MTVIYVEAFASEETHQRYTELPGHLDGQATRSGDRAHYGYFCGQTLLQDLEAAAAAHHHDMLREWQSSFEQRPSDELVGGVVPPDVLLERQEVTCRVEERCCVQPTRGFEEPLRLPELLRQRVEHLRRKLRSRRYHGTAAQLELLQARFAAHSAGARGVEVALQGFEVVIAVAPQLHVYYVVVLLGVEICIHAVADLEDILGRANDSFPIQEPSSELEVRSRRAHGDRYRPAHVAGDQTDLHGLFGGQSVWANAYAALLDHPHPDPGLATAPAGFACSLRSLQHALSARGSLIPTKV